MITTEYIDKNLRLRMVFNTVRESYIPMFHNFFGANVFSDFRTIDGITLPHRISTYLNGAKPNKRGGYAHEVTIQNICFGCFEKDEVRVFPSNQPFDESKSYLDRKAR